MSSTHPLRLATVGARFVVRIGLVALVAATGGCSAQQDGSHVEAGESKTPASPQTASVDNGKGRAQLWAENCMRCHNIRDPASYSDGQWDVAMLHMRIRANLTAEEHRKILELLKAGN